MVGNDINVTTHHVFQLDRKRHSLTEQIVPGWKRYQQVDIAFRTVFPTGHRAEDPDIPGSVFRGKRKDLTSLGS